MNYSIKYILRLLCLYVLLQFSVNAQVEIEVGPGVVRGMPIAIVPFKILDGAQLPQQIDQIVANDLTASGRFEPIASTQFLTFPSRNEEVRFKDWRFINAEGLVIGEVRPLFSGQYEITFRVYDVAREQLLGGFRYTANDSQLRGVAHGISDFVYKALLNRSGAFSSKIAFIRKSQTDVQNQRYRLMVADWDGYGEQEVYASSKPLLSPSWSPRNDKLAFVSFSDKGPVIQVLELATGQHSVVASFKGVNSAPAWSPDGTKLAYSTSKNGSPDVFVYDVQTGQHTRVTKHYGIDTEPAWSPDGNRLLFTSSRTGRPQIYEISLATNEVARVSFEGKENANASYSFDGQKMVMVYEGGQIVVIEPASGQLYWLTNAKFDESPSFSPNGDMVLYATEQNYESALMVGSSDGRVQTKLDFIRGDVREPAWSSLTQQ